MSMSLLSVQMSTPRLAGEAAWVNNGLVVQCHIFKWVRMCNRSHYWLQLPQTLGLFLFHSLFPVLLWRSLFFPSLPLHPYTSSSIFFWNHSPFGFIPNPFSLSFPSSPNCDAWLSVFSKSPLVAGTRPPPLPQTEIKTQSMATQRAAWKWEDSGEREGDEGRWERVREKAGMRKHLDTGQKPKSKGVERRITGGRRRKRDDDVNKEE